MKAKLLLTRDDTPREVDYPPATALALGVRVKASILAEEALLKKAGIGLGL